MIALIPFFETPVWDLGFMPLDSWALLVTLAFILGLEVGRARAIKLGLDIRDIYDGGLFTVGMGFFVGHIIHVIPYNMQMLEEEGWIVLLQVWRGFSSTGGFIGALIGSIIFMKLIRKRSWWVHADVIMFAFPFGYIFGRLGCFTAHDHIGIESTSFIAVDYPQPGTEECAALQNPYFCVGPRLDMALLEALWLGVICTVFFLLRNRKMPIGSYLAIWCLMYSPMRLVLDNFRNRDLVGADVRYLGLTPAQYWALTTFALGLGLLTYLREKPIVVEDEVIVIDTPGESSGEASPVAEPETDSESDSDPEAV
jgi:phosphatidylglycerol:prolipoprotein diacylglycerol transferase